MCSDDSSCSGGASPACPPEQTRGAILNHHLYQDLDLRLHIGICSKEVDGEDVLQVACLLQQMIGSRHSSDLSQSCSLPRTRLLHA